MDKTEPKQAGRRRFFQRLSIAVGVCAGVYGDARYVEPHWIETTRHDVFLPELPLALDGFQIAQLSDIHYGPVTPVSTVRDSVRIVENEAPDLVVLTGDFINRDLQEATMLAPILVPLAKIPYGVAACLGNHDYRDGSGQSVTDALRRGIGAHVLRNESHRIASGLYVAGIEDKTHGFPDPRAALQGVPARAACIYLTHNPVGVWGSSKRSCVALSGHTHGGQVCIPGYTPHRPVGMEGFPLMAGWGTFDQAHLFINRGVGLMHEPIRFRCRPEVAIITLKRGNGVPQTAPTLAARVANKAERVAISLFRMIT